MSQYWHVIDAWEQFFPIPVTVKSMGRGSGVIAVWHLGDGLTQEYRVQSIYDLYLTQADADREAARKNALALQVIHENGGFEMLGMEVLRWLQS